MGDHAPGNQAHGSWSHGSDTAQGSAPPGGWAPPGSPPTGANTVTHTVATTPAERYAAHPGAANSYAGAAVEPSVGFPLVVRFGKIGGFALIALGLLWITTALLDANGVRPVGLIFGVVFLVVGMTQATGKNYVEIEPDKVKVKSVIGTTTKTVPINGVADLQLSGKKLLRRSDGKKIAKIMTLGVNRDDANAVATAVAAAAPTSGPYAR